MKKALMAGLALSFVLSAVPASFAEMLNLDAPYGDRMPEGYQHLTTHYHNYWRAHHSPWSNIERERFVVREAQDFAKLTKIWEGRERTTFVSLPDGEVRSRLHAYLGNTAEIPAYVSEWVKNRSSVSAATREALQLNAFLPKPLSYNDITYLPDEFTKDELNMPALRYKSGFVGNDLVLYDVVTGRVRGLWRDALN